MGFGVEIGGPGGPEDYYFGLDVFQTEAHNRIVGDGNCLPFKDNSLDYITSTASVEHIPGDPVKIFQEWVRALRPGGIICCFAPALEKHGKHADHPELPNQQAPNEYTTAQWKEIIDQVTGMEIIQFDTINNNMFTVITLQKVYR
jgi:ubiquinone/menaquinone biosynthesis C-methylase UbiE